MQQHGGIDVIWPQVRGCQRYPEEAEQSLLDSEGSDIYHGVFHISEARVESQ